MVCLCIGPFLLHGDRLKMDEKLNAKPLETGGWTLLEIWEGYTSITFNPPMRVDFSVWEEPGAKIDYVTYDFGMDFKINLDAQRRSWWSYGLDWKKDPSNEEIINAIVRFDLFHAFTHYQGDPNYSHLHWALYGNLKDRCKVTEHFEKFEFDKDEFSGRPSEPPT